MSFSVPSDRKFTAKRVTAKRLAASTAIAGLTALAFTFAPATSSAPFPAPTAHAEVPQDFQPTVWDTVGALTPQQHQELQDRVAELLQEESKVLYFAFVADFNGMTSEQWALELLNSMGAGQNSAVVALALTADPANAPAGARQLATATGDQFGMDYDELADAVMTAAQDEDWLQVGLDAIDAASGSSGSETGTGLAILGVGAGSVAALAGGTAWWSNRNRKRRVAQEVSSGKEIDPRDLVSLNKLSTDALDELAAEEIISTDESIKTAETELSLARSEFGDSRVRDLEKALAASQKTLQKAFQARQTYDDGARLGETQRRTLLLDVISSCGIADDELDAQADSFRHMRQELIQAPELIDTLMQRVIAVRAQLPQAQSTLDGLRARFDEAKLQSVDDNVDLATEHTNLAENHIDQARTLVQRPAGRQQGLLEALRAADLALDQAEKLVGAVEHAEENIQTAQNSLSALIDEVRHELTEAQRLLAAPEATGINHAALEAAHREGSDALEQARQVADSDPLSAWSALTEADANLDEQLDAARDSAESFERNMVTLRNTLADAGSRIVAAEDVIETRRRIVGSKARTLLAEAKRHYAVADRIHKAPGVEYSDSPRVGIDEARQAARLAEQAARRAKDDIDDYRRRNSGSSSNSMMAGIILGSILNGGGGGGGFSGGGGFGGGGGFSGGGRNF